MGPQGERVHRDDLMQLALDVAPLPMHVGAVLVIDGPVDADGLRAALGARISGIRRLHQILVRTAPGRRVWRDTTTDLDQHVRQVAFADTGGDLLAAAVECFTAPLPRNRPLWRADVITGLPDGRTALVVTVHHVLADGTGGLALLSALADEVVSTAPAPTSAQRSTPAQRDTPAGRPSLRSALTELGAGRTPRAVRCSLNRPVGAGLQVAYARTDLAAIRRAAHEQCGTVNDAALTAVTGALGSLLEQRGESVDRLVVSIPVTGRLSADSRLGNRVGVMPVNLPTGGTPERRLARIAAITRSRKTAGRGGSVALVGPAFRALATLGLLRPLLARQRLVNTFVTNVRGPAETLHLGGRPVAEILPLGIVAGNTTVAFTVFSYAGTLQVTVLADAAFADADILVDLLQGELDHLAASGEAK